MYARRISSPFDDNDNFFFPHKDPEFSPRPQTYKLLQTRGQAASGVALVELGKQVVVQGHDGVDKMVYYAKNIHELKEDFHASVASVNENWIQPLFDQGGEVVEQGAGSAGAGARASSVEGGVELSRTASTTVRASEQNRPGTSHSQRKSEKKSPKNSPKNSPKQSPKQSPQDDSRQSELMSGAGGGETKKDD